MRTVAEIPLSDSSIPSKSDVLDWPHLKSIDLSEISGAGVGFITGLKENPRLFISLEYGAGGKGEPVGERYSLGWTVMGPMNGKRNADCCSVNRVSCK